MKVSKQADHYELIEMTEDDLRSLCALIDSSCLPEKRGWNHIKEQIKQELEKQK